MIEASDPAGKWTIQSIKASTSTGKEINFNRKDYRLLEEGDITKVLTYNKKNKLYEGNIEINHYMKNGQWNIENIIISDINGNTTFLNGYSDKMPTNVNFKVTGSKELKGNTKPVIKDIKFDKTSYKVGDIIKIYVAVEESKKLKGTSNVGGYLALPQSGGRSIDFTYNKENDRYELNYKLRYNGQTSYPFIIHTSNIYYKYEEKKVNIKVKNQLTVDTKPTIYASNKTINLGDKFNPLSGVTAKDKEDGNITSRVEVLKSNVDANKLGTYNATYVVTDTFGNRVTKTIKVSVVSNLKITSFITDKLSAQQVGTKIKLTAKTNAKDSYYEFFVKGSNGKWEKIKGMGPANYTYWTPKKAGKYTIRVRAKNVNSSKKYDSYKDISFTVK